MEVRSSLFIFEIIDEYNNIPSYSSSLIVVLFVDDFVLFDLAHLDDGVLEVGGGWGGLVEDKLEEVVGCSGWD
jgi:hypothetical protein